MKNSSALLVIIFSLALNACDNSNNNHSPNYSAKITRTEYGIPHVVADDWGSLGYGHGYVFAQDNYCMLMEGIIRANGQSLEQLGVAGGDEKTDFIFSLINNNSEGQLEQEFLSQQPDYVLQLVEGYAAGYNRYLEETGVENLAEGEPNCRNASWVRKITAVDLWKYFRLIQLQGSTAQGILKQAIIDATGPDNSNTAALPIRSQNTEDIATLINPQLGSNAIALGRDATQTGSGMLLGNPHQPWRGVGSFYQVHLTIPGEYDAMGAALKGFPKIAIGFNKDIAWTHTVSYANRFTLFELKLNPDNPLQYEVDGEMKDIIPETVNINVTLEDGSIETRQHTFYHWDYGLIVSLADAAAQIDPSFAAIFSGWPTQAGTVYALRDANINNLRGIDMWIKMGQASNIQELTQALALIGNPLFHTLAADRNGDMFYGEISAIPNVSQAQLDNCVIGINSLIKSLTNGAIIALDGSRSACQWGNDSDSPQDSGLYGYSKLPKIIDTTYAANSNDSYWLSNPDQPLEGFPELMGFLGYEGEQQNLRTQINHVMVKQRLNGTDGFDASPLFTLSSLQQLMYSNRVWGAELLLNDTLAICAVIGSPDAQQQLALDACAQLAQWDRKADTDSQGTQVFTEYWKTLQSDSNPFVNALIDNELWATPFNASQPLTTPSGINTALNSNQLRVIAALATAVTALNNADVALDAPWGEVQVFPRNGVDIPIHGGSGTMGVFGAISSGLSSGGYRSISGGNSYIQTVTWDESDCPIAEGIITHSQSIDPASPHYADQSELYSMKGWIHFPFCEADVKAAAIMESYTLKTVSPRLRY